MFSIASPISLSLSLFLSLAPPPFHNYPIRTPDVPYRIYTLTYTRVYSRLAREVVGPEADE